MLITTVYSVVFTILGILGYIYARNIAIWYTENYFDFFGLPIGSVILVLRIISILLVIIGLFIGISILVVIFFNHTILPWSLTVLI
jgi:hypothetical protein